MRNSSKSETIVLAVALAAASASAQLEWEATLRSVTVHPAQLKTTVSYPFQNTGEKPIEIVRIKTDCGCVVANLSKKSYQPGEAGELPIDFMLREREGNESKQIAVYTNASTEPTLLKIEVNIPPGYTRSTVRLVWERCDEYHEQVCKFTNQSDIPIYLTEATPTIQTIKTKLETIRPGYEYNLHVTPEKGVENLRAFIKVSTQPPEGFSESIYYKVYVFVK